eukprot:364792-Chlamydomonas_euryale.AAC.5
MQLKIWPDSSRLVVRLIHAHLVIASGYNFLASAGADAHVQHLAGRVGFLPWMQMMACPCKHVDV